MAQRVSQDATVTFVGTVREVDCCGAPISSLRRCLTSTNTRGSCKPKPSGYAKMSTPLSGPSEATRVQYPMVDPVGTDAITPCDLLWT
jgi:hypothetical protein